VKAKHEGCLHRLSDDTARSAKLCELNVIEQAANVCATTIVQDAWLHETLAAEGAASGLALVIHISELFFHCPKCMTHSKLWDSKEAACVT